ncbi:hypothetical protein [Ulvibacterium marinum]|uniref:hypothetical protein n=1 Tax=Ulvibacterium marinum TaxID=2419782 RepID=UPI002494BF0C|nr:hypothetical protein [Ulvibacterium marinum]
MVVLNILDCTLQRRIKPIQNISLIIFTLSWVLIFTLLFFDSRLASVLFYFFIAMSMVSAIAAIIFSLFFFKRKIIGVIKIRGDEITINNKNPRDINDYHLDLNVEDSKINILDKETIKKLPFWGNFFVHKNGSKIEFEPSDELKKIATYINIENTKRPVLSMKTTDLFKNLMNLLWAAS